MLPSSLRLTRTQFKEVMEKDHLVVFNRLGTLKYNKNKGFLCSVIASSKHEKKAVLRNKARRRVYSLFKSGKPSFSSVLYLSKHSYTMDFNEIKTLFHDLLSKAEKNTK